jgi:hypothetical protein
MDENMTCSPICHEVDKDPWSPGFCGGTTSKGCLVGLLGDQAIPTNLIGSIIPFSNAIYCHNRYVTIVLLL